MPNKVIAQNLYRTSVTSTAAIPPTGDFQFDVAVAPTQQNCFLILGSENIATRQIFYFHDVIGNTIYVRGINRISAAAIAVPTGYSVKMNDVAELFNYYGDNISTLFYVEKMGGLSAKVWGGYLMYNNNQVSVADKTLTLTDGTTNYIKYDAPTNTISADTTASGNIKCEVVCSGGAITSILYRTSKESYLDFAISITGALPSQGGNAGKALVTDGTNVSWGIPNGLRSSLQSDITTDGFLIAGKTKLPIVNGDFAIGSGTRTTAGWIGDASFGWYNHMGGSISAAYDSARMKISQTAAGANVSVGTSEAFTSLSQYSLPVEPNTTYTVDYDMQTNLVSGDCNEGAKLEIAVLNSAGASISTNRGPYVKTTTGNTHYTYTFTTGATARYINIAASCYGSSGAGTLIMDAWFDNIVVTCPSKEILKSISSTSTVSANDELILEKQDGSFSKLKVSDFPNGSFKAIAGETLIAGDMVCFEEQTNFALALGEITARNQATIGWLKLNEAKIGDVVGNTKRSQKIIGNGVSATTIKIGLRKNGAPVDNVTVRIETDDGTGKPTGTLAHANATGTIAGSGLSASLTGMSEQTVTFAGAFTLTDKTVYHIVVGRSGGIDASNYYFLAHINTTAFGFTTSTNNGTIWGTPTTTIMMCVVFAGSYTKIVVKTRANDQYHIFIAGICLSATSAYSSAQILGSGYSSVLTGLAKDTTYFLSNTAGVISTTPGSNIVVAGQSDNTGTGFTLTDFRGNEIYTASQVIYTNGGGTFFDLSFRATRRGSYMWVTSGGSGLYHNYSMKNGVSTGASGTVFTLNPGDLYQASEYTSNIHATVTLYEMMGSIKQATI